MKAFQIFPDQLARVAGGLVADELARRFNRHIDFLTIASWRGETVLGAGGVGLDEQECEACSERVADFFGFNSAILSDAPATCFLDFAKIISSEISKNLTRFSFTPAGHDAGAPACIHAADKILQEAAAAASLFHGRRRLLSLVAPHSLLGFELTILTPNLQSIPTLDVRGMAPAELTSTLAFGDVLVATPSLWRYMIREGLAAPDNSMAVSFGEALTPELANDLRQAGFGAIRSLYGSTETGLIGWRDSPSEGFVLFDHWRRSGDEIIRLAPTGDEAPMAPMDQLAWDADGRFNLAGRRDGAVQIGAVNVFPDKVSAALKRHPKVSDCIVRVGKMRGGADRLIADIVLDTRTAPSESTVRDIDAWGRENLRPQERPRIYNFHLAKN